MGIPKYYYRGHTVGESVTIRGRESSIGLKIVGISGPRIKREADIEVNYGYKIQRFHLNGKFVSLGDGISLKIRHIDRSASNKVNINYFLPRGYSVELNDQI